MGLFPPLADMSKKGTGTQIAKPENSSVQQTSSYLYSDLIWFVSAAMALKLDAKTANCVGTSMTSWLQEEGHLGTLKFAQHFHLANHITHPLKTKPTWI